jgi:Protein of unknown function (DUF4239)
MNITLPSAILLILISIPLSLAGIFLVRKTIKGESLRLHHDVIDPVLAVLGTLFAILIGFMLANSMQRFEEARSNIEHEAGAIADVYRLSAGFPVDVRDPMRKHCLRYVETVIKDEWPAMQEGNFSDSSWDAINEIWADCLTYQPVTQGQSNIHQLIVGAITQAGECRRTRLAQLNYRLPNTLWFIVIFGGVSTIVLTFFFSVASLRLQVAMTTIITTIIGLNIYMLAGYDAPFSGDIALTSASFKAAEEIMIRKWRLSSETPKAISEKGL